MHLIILLSFLFFSITLTAQVGIGTTTPHASAALDINDTARGLLIPRLTLNQRIAISVPAEGLMVYQTNGNKGFWYFDGGQWVKSGSGNNNSNGGKTVLILEDTITDAQAQAKIQAEVGPNTQMIRIIGCTNLTTLDLSSITTAAGIMINDNPVLQNVNLANLVSCYGNFSIQDCPQLTSLNLNSLNGVFIGTNTSEDWEFIIEETGLSTLTLPKLKKCLGALFITKNLSLSTVSLPIITITDGIWIQNNPLITSLVFPTLSTAGYIDIRNSNSLLGISFPVLSVIKNGGVYIGYNPLITSLGFPALTSASSINIYDNNSLLNVSFPLLSSITSSFSISNNSNLTSISINNLAQFGTEDFYLSFNATDNKLPSSNINSLLNKLVSITPSLTGVYMDLSQQTPLAPPTGQGITDKNTLIANGNTVTTD
jgi:hypothetical protein